MAEPAPWQQLQDALLACLRDAGLNRTVNPPLIVGYSGGLDSSVLLHAAVDCLGPAAVLAVHINHRLQAEADAWEAHACEQAGLLGCGFESVRLTPPDSVFTTGTENWARQARRTAWTDIAARRAAAAIVLAHHADDQVETLLMNWGRGAGPAGLRGMAAISQLQGVPLLRPFLSVSRTQLQSCAQARGLSWIEDPSNAQSHYKRNRLRHEVLPLLDEVFPGFRRNVLRGADLQIALLARAESDPLLSDGSATTGFDRGPWRQCADAELDAFINRWLRSLALQTATQARTRHIREQIFRSAASYAEIRHDGGLIRRYRDAVSWTKAEQGVACADSTDFVWQGEPARDLPAFKGRLLFRAAGPGEAGLPDKLLRDDSLVLSGLRMSARMRLSAGGQRKVLRKLCQQRHISAWARESLPMLEKNGQILFAGGIGMNAEFTESDGPGRLVLIFEPAAL